ncbi:MAG: hypothetical protein WC900_10510, partial [Oscillospiraceae bacterium]
MDQWKETLEQQRDAAKEAYQSIEGFWNDMIGDMMQSMDKGTSFVKSCVDVIKKYFYSLASTTIARGLTNLTSQILGISLPGTSLSGTAGNTMSMLGMGNTALNLSGINVNSILGGLSWLFGSSSVISAQMVPTLNSFMAGQGNAYSAYAAAGENEAMGALYESAGLATDGLNAAGNAALSFSKIVPYVAAAFAAFNGVKGGVSSWQEGNKMKVSMGAQIGNQFFGKEGFAGSFFGTFGLDSFWNFMTQDLLHMNQAWENEVAAFKRRILRTKLAMKAGKNTLEYDESTGSLSDLYKEESPLTDKKTLYSLQSKDYGLGVDLKNVYALADAYDEYGKTIRTTSESSAETVAQFQQLTVSNKMWSASMVAASGTAGKLAGAINEIYEKTKRLQIKAINDAIDKGAGSLLLNLQKLDSLDMDKQQLSTLKYQKTLQALTSDTIPALTSELGKARDILKETAREMENSAQAEEAMSIKTQLLLSDMQLTNAQLQALRVGKVNIDLYNAYVALGKLDQEFIIVSASGGQVVSIFEAIEKAAKGVQKELDATKEMLKGVKVSDDLKDVYTSIYQTATAVEVLAKAFQQIEDLPDVFKDMKESLTAGDLQGIGSGLINILNTMMYIAGIMEQVGANKGADFLTAVAGGGGKLYLIIEGLLVVQRIFEGIVRMSYESEGKGTFWDNLIKQLEKGGILARQFAEYLKGIKPQEITTTPGALNKMTYEQALAAGGSATNYMKYY